MSSSADDRKSKRELIQELDQLRATLADLRQRSDSYASLFKNDPDAILLTDASGQITAANPAACALFGVTEEELCRTRCAALVDPLDPHLPDLLQWHVKPGKISVELAFVRKDGARLIGEVHAVVSEGEPVRSYLIIRDISRQKTAEGELIRQRAELQLTNSRLMAMFEHSNVGLVLFDAAPPYRVLAVNRYYEQVWPEPWRSRGLVGAALTDFAPALEEAGVADVFRDVVRTRRGRVVPCTPYDHMIGGRRWWNWTLEPVMQDGQVVALAHLAVEITPEVSARELLQGIIDHIPVLLCIWDPQLQSFQFNKHLRDVLGWTEADAAGDFMAKVYPDPGYRQQIVEYMRSLEGGWRDLKTTTKDGTVIDCSWANVALPGGRMVGIGIDVRQRKAAERDIAAAREQAERHAAELEAVFAAIHNAVIVYNAAGKPVRCNPATLSAFGFDPAAATHSLSFEAVRRSVRRLDGQPIPNGQLPTQRALRGERIVGEQYLVSDACGRDVVVDATITPILGDGQIVGAVSVWHDITERIRTEQTLRENEQLLRQFLDNSPLPMGLVELPDDDSDVLHVYDNPATTQFFGLPLGSTNGKWYVRDLAGPPEKVRILIEHYRRSQREKRPVQFEYPIVINEQERQLEVVVTPVGEGVSVGTRFCYVCQDVTERRRAAAELQRAKAVAEAANRAKDQFIAMLSHELRTPLTPALAAVSALQADNRLPADVREDLAMVRRNIGLEVRLIADLLDVSRIISGKLHLEKRLIDMADVIREAARIVSGDLDAKGQLLTLETPGAPYLGFTDAARLQQVFWNLLRNAIKFTPDRGHIAVRALVVHGATCPMAAGPHSSDPAPPAQCALVVSVSDSGSGIDAQTLPRLFTAFEQAREARSFGGLGLGLAICKAVVEAHDGSIAARSDGPGQGATFMVRLPIAQCAPETPAIVSAPAQPTSRADLGVSRSLRILLVEDHADTAKLMRRLLAAEGHNVTLAGSVATGLAAVEQADPDVLISDLGLPDGTGLDLMRQLLASGKRLPAIALSGYGTAADIERSKAAGFLEHLVKPISIDTLTGALARCRR